MHEQDSTAATATQFRDPSLEAAVIGELLSGATFMPGLADVFDDPRNAAVYSAIEAVHEADAHPTLTAVRSTLVEAGTWHAIGDDYLYWLVESGSPTRANVPYYAAKLRNLAIRRSLISSLSAATHDAKASPNAPDALASARENMSKFDAELTRLDAARGPASIKSLLSEDNYGAADASEAIPSGFSRLDDALSGGFRPGSNYVFAARTAGFKSTLILNTLRNIAVSDPVLLVKLEESPREAVYRLHAAISGVPLRAIFDGIERMSAAHERRFSGAFEDLSRLQIEITGARDLRTLEGQIRQAARRGVKLVAIDQRSQLAVDADSEFERATKASNRLADLARELGVAIVLASQVNRQAAKADDPLTENDLRDSGALENDAAAVITLGRPIERSGPPGTAPLQLPVFIPKNRYGPRILEEEIWLDVWPSTCLIRPAAPRLGVAQ